MSAASNEIPNWPTYVSLQVYLIHVHTVMFHSMKKISRHTRGFVASNEQLRSLDSLHDKKINSEKSMEWTWSADTFLSWYIYISNERPFSACDAGLWTAFMHLILYAALKHDKRCTDGDNFHACINYTLLLVIEPEIHPAKTNCQRCYSSLCQFPPCLGFTYEWRQCIWVEAI